MLSVRVDLPPNPFGHLEAFARFLPKTISDALNHTAFAARGDLVDGLPEFMQIRNKWTARGMRVTKSTADSLTAHVGNIRPYMRAHTLGGERPDPGGGKQVVPVQARPRANLKTLPANWPRKLTEKGAFLATIKGVTGIWQRAKRGTQLDRRGRRKLRLMWRIVDRVELEKRWPLGAETTQSVREHWKPSTKLALQRTVAYLRERAAKGAKGGDWGLAAAQTDRVLEQL